MNPMNSDELRWRLLVSAGEDYKSLYEALWEFGLPDHATAESPSVDSVKATLARLISEGLVRLYWCAEVYGDMAPIPVDEQLAIYADEHNWRIPQQGETGVRFTSTPAGDEVLRMGREALGRE
jgi:hypothetical protein